jgi:hypothetical protein
MIVVVIVKAMVMEKMAAMTTASVEMIQVAMTEASNGMGTNN